MELRFFDVAGGTLFVRSDLESGTWTVEEYNLTFTVPYDPEKVIERGMRVGFFDAVGVFQLFEIRTAKTYAPDTYQEITAEHIVISELTDEFFEGAEWENKTAGYVLGQVLTGTLWSVGNNTASNTASLKQDFTTAYQNIKAIQDNWNVYITPRVTVNSSGITGRYLDIAPAEGTFRGLRLALEKNIDEVGVRWDDTNLKTALYGYGASVLPEGASGDADKEPLTFASVVWTATDDHPAKPLNQKYLEWSDATATYGRNGRARFGWYQNADINDPNVLLEKTWETLKTVAIPDVSIDCTVRDLHRLGYTDVPVALHDIAMIEVKGVKIASSGGPGGGGGVGLRKEVIKMAVDLLDPTATRVTIGAYVPNIVYYAKETNDKTTGGGGGGGGSGKTPHENDWIEFRTNITSDGRTLYLYGQQLDKNNNILRQAGMDIDPITGVIIYHTDYEYNLQSKINVQADRISLVVDGTGPNAHINPAKIILAINGEGGSSVEISADHIDIQGIVDAMEAMELTVQNLTVAGLTDFLGGVDAGTYVDAGDEITAGKYMKAAEYVEAGQGFKVTGDNRFATWQQKTVITAVNDMQTSARHWAYWDGSQYAYYSNAVQLVAYTTKSTDTIYYLGVV